MKFIGAKSVEASRGNGVGMWVQEVGEICCPFVLTYLARRLIVFGLLAWRDFHNHVLAAFPRVSMGRPYNEKYANVQWETNDKHFQAWKDGKTGVPIVDAVGQQPWTRKAFRADFFNPHRR